MDDGVTRRSAVVLAAVSSEPATTSELYDRVGYPALLSVGLIPYAAFREELARLSARGLVASRIEADGTTLWFRTPTAGP